MAIIATLAAMIGRRRWPTSMDAARRDKTRALIAKLHVLVMQKYESYRYRRLPIQIDPSLLRKIQSPDARPQDPLRCLAAAHADGNARALVRHHGHSRRPA